MGIERVTEAEIDLWVSRPEVGTAAVGMVVFFCGAHQPPAFALELAHPLGRQFIHVIVESAVTVEQGLKIMHGLRTRLSFGPEQTVVWGFAEGGELALRLGLSTGSALAATISVSATGPSVQSPDAQALIRRARERNFFLLHGVRDSVASPDLSRELFKALSANGGRVEFAELPMAHEVSRVALGAIRGYVVSVLGQRPEPSA